MRELTWLFLIVAPGCLAQDFVVGEWMFRKQGKANLEEYRFPKEHNLVVSNNSDGPLLRSQ
jgi:hypothetical protein